MSTQAAPAAIPAHVQEAWDRLHAELQRRLEALHERRASFKLWMEVSGSGGLPRLVEWAEHDRQQTATGREKAS